MNVLIKGMKMPESCSKCRFFVGAWCSALDESDWRAVYNKPPDAKRLTACPLVEIAEPKTGHWITDIYKHGTERHVCSNCGKGHRKNSHYCPNCGSFNGGEE